VQLRVDLTASVAKDLQRQDLNEDAHAEGTSCVALTDGASESYDSQTWARLLAAAYVQDQCVGEDWVAGRVRSYLESIDITSLSWSRQAAFERGSFATLLGLKLASNGHAIDVLAVGDSLAVHVRNGVILSSFPFARPEEFDARPRLLSTLATANAFVGEQGFFAGNNITWDVQIGDAILLVTDAVGHWLLSHPEELPKLLAVSMAEEFTQLVVEQRQTRRMRLDDSTVLRIAVEAETSELPT
jgi:hypothetical protein